MSSRHYKLRLQFIIVVLTQMIVLGATSLTPAFATGQGQAIVNAAASQAGVAYCWLGGDTSGPTHGSGDLGNGGCGTGVVGFDCSGLALYAVYQGTGITLPHGHGMESVSGGQSETEANLQPGDLAFFGGGSLSNFEHVGVFEGSASMWDANDFNVPVQVHTLAWEETALAFDGGVRYWTSTSQNHVVGAWDGGSKTLPAVFRPSNGTWYYLTGSGTVSQSYGLSGDIPTPGYYSGSTKPDYAVFRPSNSTWYYMTQTGSTASQAFGSSGDIPVPGDYGGEGHTEYAVFRPSNSTWYWLTSSGTVTQAFGQSGDVPAPAYWDGGTKTEPGVFRPSNGTWYYLTGSGTVSQSYGLSGDIPEPGYYSGSSKPDYAVFRPSNSTWYYMTQTGSTASQSYGLSGDISVPGNFSGAAKTDYGVFRPSNSTWYWLPQGGSSNSQAFGSSGDIPAETTLPYPILHSLGLL